MATLNPSVVYALLRNAGATPDEAKMLTAIAGPESGYRTEAFNGDASTGDRSYGLFQINMLGAMGPERLKALGLSSNSDLFNPVNNAKAAVMIYRRQGFAAWTAYKNGLHRPYLSRASAAAKTAEPNWQTIAYTTGGAGTDWAAGGGVGETLGGDGDSEAYWGSPGAAPDAKLPPNATPEQIEQFIRERFPQAAGFLDIPEIRAKLIDAARNSWTEQKLQAEIQSTKWWRTNSAAVRNYFALKNTDPAQLEALIQQKMEELAPEFKQYGVTGDLHKIAEDALRYGRTTEQVRQFFAKNLQQQSDKAGLAQDSAADVTADGIMAMARNEYLMPINRQDAEKWAIEIYSGRRTEEQVRAYLQRQASARFPGLEAGGFTPGDFMAPVRNVIAQTLELNPATLDLLDKRFSAVLEQQGSDGTFRPMSISEAQKWARSQQDYKFTKGAQDEAASLAETLGRAFGAVA